MLGSIELAGDQATIPAENLLRLGDTGDLGEKFATEASTDFGKCAPLGVGECDPVGQVRAQDSVLCDQVFTLKEQALIHQTCRVGQKLCPGFVPHAESAW